MALLCPSEMEEQLERAARLEEERRRVEQEAARLEAERQEAVLAKEALVRQAEDQLKSQEQLVGSGRGRASCQAAVTRLCTICGICSLLHTKSRTFVVFFK